jgi:hypothetical protein
MQATPPYVAGLAIGHSSSSGSRRSQPILVNLSGSSNGAGQLSGWSSALSPLCIHRLNRRTHPPPARERKDDDGLARPVPADGRMHAWVWFWAPMIERRRDPSWSSS